MLFNSFSYLFFLLVVYFIYFYFNNFTKSKFAKIFLIGASLFFYSWWNPKYLPLILISITFNYLIGRKIVPDCFISKSNRKIILIIGISLNLLILLYFKYLDFFILNINFLSGSQLQIYKIALPLAISFFTFQQIAFLIDCFLGKSKEYDFLNYVLFISFFPQLIAGPIVHHKQIMPQFKNTKKNNIKYKNIATGIFIFSIGLFKKVVIADSLSPIVKSGFDVASNLSFVESWLTSFAYTFQLYFDFSGYADMAIGSALILNIKLPINFNSPYKSNNLQDFWRSWHMTLGRFLKDYIYIPLGGNKSSNIRTSINLLITFLLGGFWHGAGWTFIFWGLLHGLGLIIYGFWRKANLYLPKFIGWFITFNFINITWVFFRANQWNDAIKIIRGMTGINGFCFPRIFERFVPFLVKENIEFGDLFKNIEVSNQLNFIGLIIICFVLTFFFQNTNQMVSSLKPNWFYLFFTLTISLISISFLGLQGSDSEFLYFNF
tara:strand:- start:742 stop:2214 length:1473 start_codon:yes stop_codon:yes gene_type:complete